MDAIDTLDIRHTPVFARNLATTKRIVVNQGGTRSSKTYSVLQLFVYLAFQESGLTFDVVRGTLPALRATAMKDFYDILEALGIYDPAQENKSDRTYILNGNEFCFYSVDDSQKVRGRKRDYILMNEANEITQEDFRQLMFRTTRRAFLDYNPSFTNHWIIDDVLTRDDVEIIVSTYLDNPFLDDATIQEIERYKSLDPSYWRVYGKGEMADLKQGKVFPRENYTEEEYFPLDIRSVIYCDPNLALKAKGDTTSIWKLGYSPSTRKYYVGDVVCKSFADSSELLNTVLMMKTGDTPAIGFDGNVAQESFWSNLVREWCRRHTVPFPVIDYKRYRVDELSKNTQIVWNEKRIIFPQGFRLRFENRMLLSQLHSFENKKAGNPDDAPDGLICAFEFLHERGLTVAKETDFQQPIIETERF